MRRSHTRCTQSTHTHDQSTKRMPIATWHKSHGWRRSSVRASVRSPSRNAASVVMRNLGGGYRRWLRRRFLGFALRRLLAGRARPLRFVGMWLQILYKLREDLTFGYASRRLVLARFTREFKTEFEYTSNLGIYSRKMRS